MNSEKFACPPGLQNLVPLASACCGGYGRMSELRDTWDTQDLNKEMVWWILPVWCGPVCESLLAYGQELSSSASEKDSHASLAIAFQRSGMLTLKRVHRTSEPEWALNHIVECPHNTKSLIHLKEAKDKQRFTQIVFAESDTIPYAPHSPTPAWNRDAPLRWGWAGWGLQTHISHLPPTSRLLP